MEACQIPNHTPFYCITQRFWSVVPLWDWSFRVDERGGHSKPESISEVFTISHSRGTWIGHVMNVIREEFNARLGSQGCQNLVIYNGKEEKETDKMSLKEKVGAEFPGGGTVSLPWSWGISGHYREEILQMNVGAALLDNLMLFCWLSQVHCWSLWLRCILNEAKKEVIQNSDYALQGWKLSRVWAPSGCWLQEPLKFPSWIEQKN